MWIEKHYDQRRRQPSRCVGVGDDGDPATPFGFLGNAFLSRTIQFKNTPRGSATDYDQDFQTVIFTSITFKT